MSLNSSYSLEQSPSQLPARLQQMFAQLSLPVGSLAELSSGVRLSRLVDCMLYDGQNKTLQNNIIMQNEDKKGNNVINMNIVLKQIKGNKKFPCPPHVMDLTAFKVIDSAAEMVVLLEWLEQCRSISMDKENRSAGKEKVRSPQRKTIEYGYEPQPDKAEDRDGLQNLFFLDRDMQPGHTDYEANDSLDSQPSVTKKGSFKVIRPKSNFDAEKLENQEELSGGDAGEKNSLGKQMSSEVKNELNSSQPKRYSSCTKNREETTVSRYSRERPPLYRKRQTLKDTNDQRTLPNTVEESEKKKPRAKQIVEPGPFQQNFEEEQTRKGQGEVKLNEEFSAISVRNQGYQSHKNSTRKIFKLEIARTSDAERRDIVDWLVKIGLLSSMANNYIDKFHEICRNGVIFAEIVAHHQGRSSQLYYFKNPTKSAQMHSNYKKVFEFLKQMPAFESQLIFLYDYFIPEPTEPAFWSLLRSCHRCFCRKSSHDRSSTGARGTNSTKREIQVEYNGVATEGTCRKSRQSIDSYEKVLPSQSITKITNKNKQHPYQSIPPRKQKVSTPASGKGERRKGSLDFIKQLPDITPGSLYKQELVQKQEPIQGAVQNYKGYKALYDQKRNYNLDRSSLIMTPEKKKMEISMNNSRVKKTESTKKLKMPSATQKPSVTLQIQIKSLKYLREKNLLKQANNEDHYVTLFEDEIRNGVLFNKIIEIETRTKHQYIARPRNIIDCRNNYTTGFEALRKQGILVPKTYQQHYEQIIKGNSTMFYGLVHHVTWGKVTQPHGNRNQLQYSENNHRVQPSHIVKQVLEWVRYLEQSNPEIAQMKIRDWSSLVQALLEDNLLYRVATILLPSKYTIRPIYDKSRNYLEQEVNMKKIVTFLRQNMVIRTEIAQKYKAIVKKQMNSVCQLFRQLMSYWRVANPHTWKPPAPEQPKPISFNNYIQEMPSKPSLDNPHRVSRLETTMANNSLNYPNHHDHNHIETEPAKAGSCEQIEVPWMRRMGFDGDIAINNGVILCRLMSKLTMQTVNFKDQPHSKAECLFNIRRALKLMGKCSWDEEDILGAGAKTTMEVYSYLRDTYRNSYAFKMMK